MPSRDQEPGQPGSFGEAMARSREAVREKASEQAARPAPSRPVRRTADAEKARTPDNADPVAVPLVLFPEVKLAATATASAIGTATAVASTAAAATAAAISPLAVDAGAKAATSATGFPGEPADALTGDLAELGLPGGHSSVPAAAPAPPGALASSAGSAGSAATFRTVDTAALVVPTPGHASSIPIGIAIPPGVDPAPAPARAAPASAGLPLAADPRTAVAQADAAGADLADASSGQESDGPGSTAATPDGQAGASLTATDMPTDTPLVAGTDLLMPPASGALQQPGNLAAANAPASPTAPNAPDRVASALLIPDVGSSEWGKALSQQLIHLSAADRQVAELQLNPPGLGPLKVMLSLGDQQMQAAFVSAHASVRAAVEAALPQLRALLAENGISLGQTSVGAESQPQTAFSQGQGDFGGQPPRPGPRARNVQAAALFAAQPVSVQRRPGQGLQIDTYA